MLEVGRGLAAGDLDNDGGTDLVVSNNNGTLRVLLNKVGAAKPWLGLRLLSGKRDAYGAKVEIKRQGAPPLWRRVRADGSYLSANDPRIVVMEGVNARYLRGTGLRAKVTRTASGYAVTTSEAARSASHPRSRRRRGWLW